MWCARLDVANFPVLKTGAVAQYGSDRTRRYATEVFRFVDGSEQRFVQFGATLRRWTVRLDLLDEAELEAVEEFFWSEEGRAGSFEFTDPWDGAAYEDCSFESDELTVEYRGVGRAVMAVAIKENR